MEVAHSYELSTNQAFSYLHELNYPFNPFDYSPYATVLSRKKRAMSDLAEDHLSDFDGWKLTHEEFSLDLHSLPPLINGDPIQDPAAVVDENHVLDQSLITAPPRKCSDIEEVLNMLWMEDDTASTAQSASSALGASSDQISLISDLDWDYGAIESSSSNQGDSRSASSLHILEPNKEGLLGGSSGMAEDDFVYNWDIKSQEIKQAIAGSEAICAGQLQRAEEGKPSCWQPMEEQAEQVRTSWQCGLARTSWQLKQEGSRATCWQPKQGQQTRASWQGESKAMAESGYTQDQSVEGTVPAPILLPVSEPPPSFKRSRSGAWAGPTLLDIESALAFHSSDSPNSTGTISSLSPLSSPSTIATPKPSISPFFDIKKLLSDDPTKSTGDQDTLDRSWRLKLQKRNSLEPKYTVRVESEEKALADGYRWRKYGQKTIKNSPFPRSYYKCSSGKCNAKKQVEKGDEDGGLFLVTYEGIHLHHKPNPPHKNRASGDSHEDSRSKTSTCLPPPSLLTSCSFSNPSAGTPLSLLHPLLT